MPSPDSASMAENAMFVGICMCSLGDIARALEFFDKEFDIYVTSGHSRPSLQSFSAMSMVCYHHDSFSECIKFAQTAHEISVHLNCTKFQAITTFHIEYAKAMCRCQKEAIELFRLLNTLPALSNSQRNRVPDKLMFADCLQREKHTSEALEALYSVKDTLEQGPKLRLCNVITGGSGKLRRRRFSKLHFRFSSTKYAHCVAAKRFQTVSTQVIQNEGGGARDDGQDHGSRTSPAGE
jgi:hypothetical protein